MENTIIIIALIATNLGSVIVFVRHIERLQEKLMAKDLTEYKMLEKQDDINYNEDKLDETVDPFTAPAEEVLEAFSKQAALQQIKNG